MIESIPEESSMRVKPRTLLIVIAIAVVAATGARAESPSGSRPAAATSNGVAEAKILAPYDMSWWSVDGGGGSSAGGVFAVIGAIGQPDTGVASACAVAMESGVWSGLVFVEMPMFCNGFESGDTGAWASVTP